MIAYTQNTMLKLQDLLNTLGYTVRLEKGNFRSGSCLLQQERILVINKFSDTEVKIKAMLALLQDLDVPIHELDEKQRKFLFSVQQVKLDL